MDQVSAREQAEYWLKTEEGLQNCRLSQGSESRGVWVFSVIQFVHEVRRDFRLCKLVVLEDDDILVVHDDRERVKELLQNPSGFLRENQLFDAFVESGATYPSWFVRLTRVDTYMDKRGVDGFGQVCIPGVDTLKVPFQIKSSVEAMHKFFKEWPLHQGVVVPMVVRETDSNTLLRAKLLGELARYRARILKGEYTLAECKRRITSAISG